MVTGLIERQSPLLDEMTHNTLKRAPSDDLDGDSEHLLKPNFEVG